VLPPASWPVQPRRTPSESDADIRSSDDGESSRCCSTTATLSVRTGSRGSSPRQQAEVGAELSCAQQRSHDDESGSRKRSLAQVANAASQQARSKLPEHGHKASRRAEPPHSPSSAGTEKGASPRSSHSDLSSGTELQCRRGSSTSKTDHSVEGGSTSGGEGQELKLDDVLDVLDDWDEFERQPSMMRSSSLPLGSAKPEASKSSKASEQSASDEADAFQRNAASWGAYDDSADTWLRNLSGDKFAQPPRGLSSGQPRDATGGAAVGDADDPRAHTSTRADSSTDGDARD